MSMRWFKDPVSGLSHAAGLLFALFGSVWLVLRARDAATLTTLAVYALSLVVLYTASSVYHLVTAGERTARALRFWRSAPRAVYTVMYVAMGWSVVAVGRALFSALPAACLACVVGGGVVYTIGAAIYATKWPNPKPPWFGFHEVWHFFVLGGSALHFAAIAQLPA